MSNLKNGIKIFLAFILPIIVGLLAYIYFLDEESYISRYCFSFSFLPLGILLSIAVAKNYYDIEPKEKTLKYYLYSIFIWSVLLLLLASFIIPFIVDYPFSDFLKIKQIVILRNAITYTSLISPLKFRTLWMILIILFLCYIFLLISYKLSVKYKYKKIYLFRFFYNVAESLFVKFLFILLLYHSILIFVADIPAGHFNGHPFGSLSIVDKLVNLGFLFALEGLLGYKIFNKKRFGIFTFAEMNFVLFLRSFTKDCSPYVQGIYNELYAYTYVLLNIPLVNIGNPQLIDGFDGTHWLPLANWKFFLSYYIKQAKICIVLLGDSDGLQWEIVTHQYLHDKFIFCYETKADLQTTNQKLMTSNSKNMDIFRCALNYLYNNFDEESLAFVIRGEDLYVDTPCNLMEASINNRFNDVKCIHLKEISIVNKEKKIKKQSKGVLHLINFAEFSSFKIWHIFSGVNTYLISAFVNIVKYVIIVVFHVSVVVVLLLLNLALVIPPLWDWLFNAELVWFQRILAVLLSDLFLFIYIGRRK